MIELGGNIKLDGFSNLDPAMLIVVKKMVATAQENGCEFQEFSLVLTQDDDVTLATSLKGKKEYAATASNKNFFFAMEKALAKVSALVRE